ncbi:hypothetical protein ARTHRO9AX_220020 [Arthrobacter sp. 9AX]|nr:hypothetical protein ARTHRO9AX_220020 [Arthrobacter sp. 9AX]
MRLRPAGRNPGVKFASNPPPLRYEYEAQPIFFKDQSSDGYSINPTSGWREHLPGIAGRDPVRSPPARHSHS